MITREEQIAFITEWIYKIFGDKFKFILGFENGDLYDDKHKAYANIGWAHNKNKYFINISPTADKKTLMHELGHLLLEQKLGFDFMKVEESDKRDSELKKYIIPFLDCFSDYNLISEFPEYRQEFMKRVDIDLRHTITKDLSSFNNLITYYLLFYIQLNFILNHQDKTKRFDRIKYFLKQARKAIIEKSNKKFYYQKFQQLDKQLNRFKQIKNTNSSKVFLDFIYETLEILEFWSKTYLKEQFNLYFNYMERDF